MKPIPRHVLSTSSPKNVQALAQQAQPPAPGLKDPPLADPPRTPRTNPLRVSQDDHFWKDTELPFEARPNDLKAKLYQYSEGFSNALGFLSKRNTSTVKSIKYKEQTSQVVTGIRLHNTFHGMIGGIGNTGGGQNGNTFSAISNVRNNISEYMRSPTTTHQTSRMLNPRPISIINYPSYGDVTNPSEDLELIKMDTAPKNPSPKRPSKAVPTRKDVSNVSQSLKSVACASLPPVPPLIAKLPGQSAPLGPLGPLGQSGLFGPLVPSGPSGQSPSFCGPGPAMPPGQSVAPGPALPSEPALPVFSPGLPVPPVQDLRGTLHFSNLQHCPRPI